MAELTNRQIGGSAEATVTVLLDSRERTFAGVTPTST